MSKENEPAIVVEGLHKEFVLPHTKRNSIKQAFVNIGGHKNYKTTQKVLDGVSFTINKGDFFGIVGRNGSGKSTLLKILAGVYYPSAGDVEVRGQLTPFIELGVGFNPELSGRDNVFLNGALLGFSHKEMEEMYDEIVAFAELGQFMDQKLKNYSSGMQVRLAFSIAVKAHNDILIFDEVLAVGDEAFQRKCLDIFEQYKARKQTVILVTHDMETVRRFCTRALLLDQGKILEIGNPRKVARVYSDLNQQATDSATAADNKGRSSASCLKARISDADGRVRQSFAVGGTMVVGLSWKGIDSTKMESLGVNIFKASGEHVTGINSRFTDLPDGWKERDSIDLEFTLDIAPGKYHLLIEAFEAEGQVMDAILEGPQFSVTKDDSPMTWSGMIELPHKWTSGR